MMDNDPENPDNSVDISVKIINDQDKTSKETYDNYSGRLVDYPSDSDEADDDDTAGGEGARELSPRAPSTPASPSLSPEQSRRNAQGEAVLNTFGSRGILYLLGEA